MQRRSSSKRAFSPSLGTEGPAPKMPQLDSSGLGKTLAIVEHDRADDADEAPGPDEAKETNKPSMPNFLNLSEDSRETPPRDIVSRYIY